MKKIMFLVSLVSIATLAQAQQMGRVISSTPITQTISVPQQICNQTYVAEPTYSANGGNAVIGAIAGGLLGNAIGNGGYGYYGGYDRNNERAIILGAVSGALIGSQVNSGSGYVNRQVQNCYTQNSYQNNVTGYEVVYELNGGVYTTQTSSPPGGYINLGYNNNNSPYPVYNQPRYYQPTPVYTAPPVYYTSPPAYYRPYRGHRRW